MIRFEQEAINEGRPMTPEKRLLFGPKYGYTAVSEERKQALIMLVLLGIVVVVQWFSSEHLTTIDWIFGVAFLLYCTLRIQIAELHDMLERQSDLATIFRDEIINTIYLKTEPEPEQSGDPNWIHTSDCPCSDCVKARHGL
jgi:hypothetical protein